MSGSYVGNFSFKKFALSWKNIIFSKKSSSLLCDARWCPSRGNVSLVLCIDLSLMYCSTVFDVVSPMPSHNKRMSVTPSISKHLLWKLEIMRKLGLSLHKVKVQLIKSLGHFKDEEKFSLFRFEFSKENMLFYTLNEMMLILNYNYDSKGKQYVNARSYIYMLMTKKIVQTTLAMPL